MATLTTHPQARELHADQYYDVHTDTMQTVTDTLREHYATFWSPIRTVVVGGGGAGQDGATFAPTDVDADLFYTTEQGTSTDLVPAAPSGADGGTPLVVLAPTAYPAEFIGPPAPAPIPQRSYAIILEELAYLTQHLGIDATRPVDEQMMALREWIESRHANMFS